ncbi:MAG: OmpA family protein [Cytophagales bacterium]|nr:MAG: OmpA family protein [Cytophagales bacterium]
MYNKLFSITILLGFLSTMLFGQSNFLPKNLGANINSPDYAEINPVITADGKTLYFIRVSHPENSHDPDDHLGPHDSQDVWYSELQTNGTWGVAKRLDNINLSIYNAILSISDDGKLILINGIYDKKGRWLKRGLSVCTKEGSVWGAPTKLNVPKFSRKNKGKASNSSMSGDGKVIFMSYTHRYNGKRKNIYVSINNSGEWSKPVKLPKLINAAKSSEETPYYNPIEQKLYFSSNKLAGSGRAKRFEYDVFVSKKLDNSFLNWSEPKKLSDTINTPYWDSYYKMNSKGSWAYFASNRDSKGVSEPDIFRVKIFEENPFIIIKGFVKDKNKNQNIDFKKYPYKIMSNGKVLDSIKINPDSGNFIIKLPLGADYILAADAKNHKSIADTIKAKSLVEYTELNKNLFVEPVPYVLVQGKILNRSTMSPLPSNLEYKVMNDNMVVPLETIDYQTGDYKMKLEFGKKYLISVKADKFIPENALVDLTNVDEYKEINKDLFVQKLIVPEPNVAIISGKVIDKKTGLPISPNVTWSVNANDVPVNEINIDNLTGTYKMKVPLGKIYVINALADGYYPVYEMIDLNTAGAPKSVTKDLVIAPVEVGISIKINNIFFETGKSLLKKESFPELERLVKFLVSSPSVKVEIDGHTDNVGKPAANLKLSQSRAESVVSYLLDHGVAPDRLVAKGFGMTKPVATNKTKLGKSLNRRVEFTILSK